MREVYAIETNGNARLLGKDEKYDGSKLHVKYSGHRYYATPGPELTESQLKVARKYFDPSVLDNYDNWFIVYRDTAFLEADILQGLTAGKWTLMSKTPFSGKAFRLIFDTENDDFYWHIGTYCVSVKG